MDEPGLEAFPDAVVSTDPGGVVVGWNAAAAALLGVDARAAIGLPLSATLRLAPRDDSGEHPGRQWAATASITIPVEVTSWSSAGADGAHQHLCLRDARARVAEEAEVARAETVLRRQARYDALTGLANRYELEERLTEALDGSDDVALVVVDLDGFKPINDSFGHGVGDEVLTAVAARLRAAVRSGVGRGPDTVARLGGDEFVVLTPADPAGPAAVVTRVRQALDGPITTSVGPLRIGASIGIAVSHADSDPDDLLRRADKAMYRTKLARDAHTDHPGH